ncbi:hypothetical protein DXG01_011299, partial [Tephrocybe rancida]
MSPPTKRYTRSASNAPDIPLLQNGKAPQALKPTETRESTNKNTDANPTKAIQKTRQSRNADEDIITDDVQAPPPAQKRPVPCKKKTAAPVTAALSTNAEDGSFMPAHALKKWLPNRLAAEEDAPPLSQPAPPLPQPVPPSQSRSQSPEDNKEDGKTPPPPSTQPHRALPLPSQSPRTPSPPIVHDPGFTPSPSNFETTSAQERLHISEELDEEDDVVFGKEIKAKTKAKVKKGKGKARDNNGPFKLGPIPDEVKERLYTIHANFKRQVEELAAEIGKSLHLLFSLLVLKEEWARIVSFEYNKYCDENLGPLSKDPDARADLLKPELEWYAAKYGMYAEEKKTDGTFNKVITKAQQDFVHL